MWMKRDSSLKWTIIVKSYWPCDLDLWLLNPKTMSLLVYPRIIPYTKFEHFVSELYCGQTDKQTVSNVLATPTDKVGVGNNAPKAQFPLPDLTVRVNGPSWRVTGFHYPSTRPVLTGNGNRSPVNSSRLLGLSTRVVETGLNFSTCPISSIVFATWAGKLVTIQPRCGNSRFYVLHILYRVWW